MHRLRVPLHRLITWRSIECCNTACQLSGALHGMRPCSICSVLKGRRGKGEGWLQVGVVRESEGRVFRVLTTDEVEDHLTAISERD